MGRLGVGLELKQKTKQNKKTLESPDKIVETAPFFALNSWGRQEKRKGTDVKSNLVSRQELEPATCWSDATIDMLFTGTVSSKMRICSTDLKIYPGRKLLQNPALPKGHHCLGLSPGTGLTLSTWPQSSPHVNVHPSLLIWVRYLPTHSRHGGYNPGLRYVGGKGTTPRLFQQYCLNSCPCL